MLSLWVLSTWVSCACLSDSRSLVSVWDSYQWSWLKLTPVLVRISSFAKKLSNGAKFGVLSDLLRSLNLCLLRKRSEFQQESSLCLHQNFTGLMHLFLRFLLWIHLLCWVGLLRKSFLSLLTGTKTHLLILDFLLCLTSPIFVSSTLSRFIRFDHFCLWLQCLVWCRKLNLAKTCSRICISCYPYSIWLFSWVLLSLDFQSVEAFDLFRGILYDRRKSVNPKTLFEH